MLARVRAERLRQHRRRLLRHDTRAHPRDRRRRREAAAARRSERSGDRGCLKPEICGLAPPTRREGRGKRAGTADLAPRPMRLAGLEPLTIGDDSLFVNVGERTNVTGSKAFARLILSGDYAGAVEVARSQVANGAQIIDVNMDEAMLDSKAAMVRFPVPDRRRARHRARAGDDRLVEVGGDRGGPQVRAGQADRQLDLAEGRRGGVPASRAARAPLRRRRRSSWRSTRRDRPTRWSARRRSRSRSYDLLVDKAGFPPEDIVIDPNVFAIATGIDEHNNYAVDFIDATRWIRTHLPHAKVSGGISNVSFSFRGNEPVREAIHTVFLYHAIRAGLTMGIVNAGQLGVYDELDPKLRELVEDVVLNRRRADGASPTGAARHVRRVVQGGGPQAGGGPCMARRRGRGTADARAGQGHRQLDRRGHRSGAPRRRRRAAASRSR